MQQSDWSMQVLANRLRVMLTLMHGLLDDMQYC